MEAVEQNAVCTLLREFLKERRLQVGPLCRNNHDRPTNHIPRPLDSLTKQLHEGGINANNTALKQPCLMRSFALVSAHCVGRKSLRNTTHTSSGQINARSARQLHPATISLFTSISLSAAALTHRERTGEKEPGDEEANKMHKCPG